MYRRAMGAAAITLALALVSSGPAAAQRIKAGALNCDVSAGWGWIIGSVKSVQCIFTPDIPGPQEAYVGSISKFGVDVGATGQATVAVGLGANVLVGGSNRAVALQPLSLTGQTGLNLAVGVAELQLRPAGR